MCDLYDVTFSSTHITLTQLRKVHYIVAIILSNFDGTNALVGYFSEGTHSPLIDMQECDILEHSATDHEAACCMPSQSL